MADEFKALSDSANVHGRKSDEFKAAALKLQACQQRRTRQLGAIEARCGPAQEAYRLCIEKITADGRSDVQCLPVLHTFLDCADSALRG